MSCAIETCTSTACVPVRFGCLPAHSYALRPLKTRVVCGGLFSWWLLATCYPACGHGQCLNVRKAPRCVCEDGWRGEACQRAVCGGGCEHGECDWPVRFFPKRIY